MMDRRRFLLTSLAGALAAPLAAGAQQQAAKMYRIAMLAAGPSACPETSVTRAFRRGLAEAGYTEERDFILDRRCFPTDDTAAPVAADLLKQRPTVFVAAGHPAAIAVNNLATVPVVFAAVDDPVGSGLVRSLAQPGTNMTGVTDITTQLYPKRLEILKEALPALRRMATLAAPTGYSMQGVRADIDGAATALAIQLRHFTVRKPDEIVSAFETMKRNGIEALIVIQSALTWSERARIIDRALRHRLPAIYPWPEPATEKGGLIAFGADQAALFIQVAGYVTKILRGSKPADLPVAQPTKYQLVINLKTAKALGLTIPPSLLARADHVIE
jgi:putative tryptophan/tyrosine transport system substrate-binding protein